jgi:hypothetical protein
VERPRSSPFIIPPALPPGDFTVLRAILSVIGSYAAMVVFMIVALTIGMFAFGVERT